MHESIIKIIISGSIETGMAAHFIPERWLTLLRTTGSGDCGIFMMIFYPL
jgi:hypothetical protein